MMIVLNINGYTEKHYQNLFITDTPGWNQTNCESSRSHLDRNLWLSWTGSLGKWNWIEKMPEFGVNWTISKGGPVRVDIPNHKQGDRSTNPGRGLIQPIKKAQVRLDVEFNLATSAAKTTPQWPPCAEEVLGDATLMQHGGQGTVKQFTEPPAGNAQTASQSAVRHGQYTGGPWQARKRTGHSQCGAAINGPCQCRTTHEGLILWSSLQGHQPPQDSIISNSHDSHDTPDPLLDSSAVYTQSGQHGTTHRTPTPTPHPPPPHTHTPPRFIG